MNTIELPSIILHFSGYIVKSYPNRVGLGVENWGTIQLFMEVPPTRDLRLVNYMYDVICNSGHV